jgi:hypothetical protein
MTSFALTVIVWQAQAGKAASVSGPWLDKVEEHAISNGEWEMKRGSAFLMGILLSASGGWGQAKGTTIRIEGSPSMVPCTQRLTEWYHNNHANVSFTVDGQAPAKAMAALVEGKADVAQSSRKVLGGEIGALQDKRGKKFVQVPVAAGGRRDSGKSVEPNPRDVYFRFEASFIGRGEKLEAGRRKRRVDPDLRKG